MRESPNSHDRHFYNSGQWRRVVLSRAQDGNWHECPIPGPLALRALSLEVPCQPRNVSEAHVCAIDQAMKCLGSCVIPLLPGGREASHVRARALPKICIFEVMTPVRGFALVYGCVARATMLVRRA